jgi:hypothetical protein
MSDVPTDPQVGDDDASVCAVQCATNEGGDRVGILDFGAVQEMKGLWPFGVALRGEASNHLTLRWLKTVVVNGEEKAPV